MFCCNNKQHHNLSGQQKYLPQVIYSSSVSCSSAPDTSSLQDEGLVNCCSVFSLPPSRRGAKEPPPLSFPLTTFKRKGSLKGCGVETSSSYQDTRLCLPTAGPKPPLPLSRNGLWPSGGMESWALEPFYLNCPKRAFGCH